MPQREEVKEVPQREEVKEVPQREEVKEVPQREEVKEVPQREEVKEVPQREEVKEVPQREEVKEVPQREEVKGRELPVSTQHTHPINAVCAGHCPICVVSLWWPLGVMAMCHVRTALYHVTQNKQTTNKCFFCFV